MTSCPTAASRARRLACSQPGRKTAGQQVDVLALVQTVRFSPVPVTMFLLGLGVATTLAAVAIWRSGSLPRYSGVVFAVGFVVFNLQFYAPPAARIAHGVLVGIGCTGVAVALDGEAEPGQRLRTFRDGEFTCLLQMLHASRDVHAVAVN